MVVVCSIVWCAFQTHSVCMILQVCVQCPVCIVLTVDAPNEPPSLFNCVLRPDLTLSTITATMNAGFVRCPRCRVSGQQRVEETPEDLQGAGLQETRWNLDWFQRFIFIAIDRPMRYHLAKPMSEQSLTTKISGSPQKVECPSMEWLQYNSSMGHVSWGVSFYPSISASFFMYCTASPLCAQYSYDTRTINR